MNLSQLLAEARKRRGLTQEDLADAAGVTVRTIQRIESGDTVPRAFTVKALAEALGVPFESLQPVPERATPEPPAGVPVLPVEAPPAPDPVDARHFLQLHTLSCFSYLVLPLVHFLLPHFLLRRRTGLPLPFLRFARSTVRGQVIWIVLLNLLLLGLLGWNILRTARFGGGGIVGYGWPVGLLYAANAVLIAWRLVLARRLPAV
ncbi:MAG: helix-turn-helix domain-containing protein [Chitinophagaceae bacterium]|nr:MAG: helix-turn-helix domain-containing protein [Chitinophagaceae bacterium]